MKRIIALLMVMAMLFMVACGGEEKTAEAPDTPQETKVEETADTPEETPKEEEKNYREKLNVVLTAAPPTLDPPLTTSQIALNIAMNFYETLYIQDENFTPQPMLAESYTVSDDKKEYTFTIREGVKFHDGSDLTAEDVVASMNYWLEKSSRAQSLLGAGTFEVVDEKNVKGVFENPTNDLLNLMSARANFPAIRQKSVIENAPEEGINTYIGTGPYKFKEWVQDQYIVLEKFDDYKPLDMEPSGYAGRKTPITQEIYYHFVPESATRVAGLQSGTYDISGDLPVESFETIKQDPNITVSTQEGGTLTLFMNTKQGVLSDVNMRKAVQILLDDDEIMLASFSYPELYTLDPGFMSPQMAQFASKAGSDVYNQKDETKAKEYLKQASYNGEKLVLLTTPDYQEMYNSSLVIAEQLKKIGVNAEVVSYDFSTFMDKKEDPANWDIFITSNGYQVAPQQLLVVNPGWAGHDDEKLQSMVKELQGAESTEVASKKWDEIQNYIYHDYVSTLALGQYNDAIAYRNEVEGLIHFQAPIVWNAGIVE